MEKDFDFDSIGKQTPYVVPDVFFDSMQQEVLTRVAADRSRLQKRRRMLWGAVAVAALVAGLCFLPFFHSADKAPLPSARVLAVDNGTAVDPIDQWISELSDEELEELVSFSENDIFLD